MVRLEKEQGMKVNQIDVTWKRREHSRSNIELFKTELKHLQNRDANPNLYEPLTSADRQRMIYLNATLQSLNVVV